MDVNKINARYFSKGAQLELYKHHYLDLLPPEKVLFPRYISGADKVLDLGCGAGRTTARIGELAGEVIGTDISEVMVETAQDKNPGLEFRVMDAARIVYPDAQFDVVVFSYNGPSYLYPEEKRQSSMREVHRVLKNNGKFIFSSFTRYPPYTLSSLVNLVVTRLLMGLRTRYKIHVTRHGVTVNFEPSPEEEVQLLEAMGFVLDEMMPMAEKVGFFGYTPDISTYYVFSKR